MSETNENKAVFYIQTLGDTAFYYNDQKIQFSCKLSSKYIQLLLLLLFGKTSGSEGIKRSEIQEALYSWEDVANAGNAMRINMSRLRKLLADAGIPGSKYIKIEDDCYSLELDCPIGSDVWSMENTMAEAETEENEDRRLELLKKATHIYHGGFLSVFAGEEWVAVKDVYCQKLYFSAVRGACRILNSRKSYEAVLDISRKAASLYPFEEWQLLEIDSFMYLNRYDEALRSYEDAVSKAYEELGLSPSQDMLKRFRDMSGHIKSSFKSLEEIFYLMEEKKTDKGAYYTSYPSFIDCFRLLTRMSERSGWKGCLLLCTLEMPVAKSAASADKIQKAGNTLMECLHNVLRRGDLYTRFSPSQFLVLLNGATVQNSSIISQRISQEFSMEKKLKVEIRFNISGVGYDKPKK